MHYPASPEQHAYGIVYRRAERTGTAALTLSAGMILGSFAIYAARHRVASLACFTSAIALATSSDFLLHRTVREAQKARQLSETDRLLARRMAPALDESYLDSIRHTIAGVAQ